MKTVLVLVALPWAFVALVWVIALALGFRP